MKIKVCGLTDPENCLEVAALKPDMIGFVFYKPSKRCANEVILQEVMDRIPASVLKAGVFVNAPVQEVLKKVEQLHLEAVQLHGDESPDYCRLIHKKVKVIKAFGIDCHFDFEVCKYYRKSADFFLFDTATAGFGGSGLQFNHQLLKHYTSDTPFLLSGGIGLHEARTILQTPPHEQCAGIDVNSKVEGADFKKDITVLTELFKLKNDKYVSHY